MGIAINTMRMHKIPASACHYLGLEVSFVSYELILEKANYYANTITALTPNESSKLNETYEELKNWFNSIPREFANESVQIRKYACLSHYYRWTEQYTELFRCIIEIQGLTSNNTDSLYCGWIYRNASRIANFLGMVNESIDYGYKAIALIERSQNQSEICKCYNSIGGCFNILEFYDVAFDFYKKAYKIATETKSFTSKLISLNNMGYNRVLAKDYQNAGKILTKAKKQLGFEQTRHDLHIQIHNNLAMVALYNNHFDEAHEYIAIAKYYNAINKVTSDAISILQVESDIFLEENRPQEAIDCLESALELAVLKKLERYALKIEKALAEVLMRVHRFEEATKHLQNGLSLQEKFTIDLAQSQIQIMHYEQEVRESKAILEKRLHQSVKAISKIGELRDVYTAGHQKRVADLAYAIGVDIGLSDERLNNLSLGALIHDIGKINISSDILTKPGKITNLEYQILQTHCEHGYNVVKEVGFPDEIPLMIYQHHERIDGSGYPQGLTGDQIIEESKILAVADVVEAMTSHRPYRPSLGIEKALEEITSYKGKRYDAAIVEICIHLFRVKNFAFKD